MSSADYPPHGDPGPVGASPANLDAALHRLRGDRALLVELIRCYEEDCPKLLAQVGAAARDGQFETLQSSAHSLKGLAANFDAAPTVALAAQLERAAQRNDQQGAATLVPQLEAATIELGRELSAFKTLEGS